MVITEKIEKKSRQQSSNAIEALFADAITRVKAQAAQAIAEQKANSEAQARQTQQMIVNIKAEYEQKLAKANLDAEVTIANEKAKAKKAAGQIVKVEAEAEENTKALLEQVAQLKTRLAEKQKNHAKQIAGIKVEHKQKIAKIKLDTGDAIVRAKAGEAKAAQQESQAKAEEKTKTLVDQIAQLKAKLTEKENAHTEQINNIKAETEESIANIEAEYEQQLAKAKAEAEEKITQIKTEAEAKGKNHNEEINKIRNENEEKIKGLTGQISELETKAAEEQKAYAEQITKTEGEEAIVKIKADYEEQINKIKAEYDETITQLKTEVGENAAKVNPETEVEKKSNDEEIAKIKAESEDRAKALTEQITKLESEASEKDEAHAEKVANLNAGKEEAIAKIKAEYEEQIAKARAEIEENVQELERTAKEKVEEEIGVEVKGQAKADDTDTSVPGSAIEEKHGIMAKELAPGEVAKAIQEMIGASAVPSDKQSITSSGLCADDIMEKELIWASPEDSIQQALTKMQQSHTGYILISQNGTPEGIVSKSDLTGAVSPYLRPEFAKWRRPLDDATLQIKIKWIMNKSTHTISPQTPLADIIKSMCQFGFHALPVIDEQGKVQGLVAEVNIFKAILMNSRDLCNAQKIHQEQPESEHPADSKSTHPAAETM